MPGGSHGPLPQVIHPVENIQLQYPDLQGLRECDPLDEEIHNSVLVLLRNGRVCSLYQLPSRLSPKTDEDVLTHGQS